MERHLERAAILSAAIALISCGGKEGERSDTSTDSSEDLGPEVDAEADPDGTVDPDLELDEDGGWDVPQDEDAEEPYEPCDAITFPGIASRVFDLRMATEDPHEGPYGTSFQNAFAQVTFVRTALTFVNPWFQAELDRPVPSSTTDPAPLVALLELRLPSPDSPAIDVPFRSLVYRGDLPSLDPPTCAHPEEPTSGSEVCSYTVRPESFREEGDRCIPLADLPSGVLTRKTNSTTGTTDTVLDASESSALLSLPFMWEALEVRLHGLAIETLYAYDTGTGLELGGMSGSGTSARPLGVLAGTICMDELALDLETFYWNPDLSDYRDVIRAFKCDVSCSCVSTNPSICPGPASELQCSSGCTDPAGDVEGVCPGDETGSPDGISVVFTFHSAGAAISTVSGP